MRISIHALRKESDGLYQRFVWQKKISIHALRKESDVESSLVLTVSYSFQSTLSVRRATNPDRKSFSSAEFQSTLSVRRATTCNCHPIWIGRISIHALRKESDIIGIMSQKVVIISIHALRKESDPDSFINQAFKGISIHALRKESDPMGEVVVPRPWISIHALRKESDLAIKIAPSSSWNFNPRSP